MDSKDKPGPMPSTAEMSPSTNALKAGPEKKGLSLKQRALRAALAPLVAMGFAAGTTASTVEASPVSRSNETPPTTAVREENPDPADTIDPRSSELHSTSAPEMPDGVPADLPSDIYAKSGSAGDTGPKSPEFGGSPAFPSVEIDGNKRIINPDGSESDMLPMTRPDEDSPVMAKTDTDNPEVTTDDGSSPIEAADPGRTEAPAAAPMYIDGNGRGENGEDILPMVKPDETSPVMAKADTSSASDDEGATQPKTVPAAVPMEVDGNQRGENPDGSRSDILPMAEPSDSMPVTAQAPRDPGKGTFPVPDTEKPLVTPMVPKADDAPVDA